MNNFFLETYFFFLKHAGGKDFTAKNEMNQPEAVSIKMDMCEKFPRDFTDWFKFLTRYRNRE
jgi:hypothetical protein